MQFTPPFSRDAAYRRKMVQVFMTSTIEVVRPRTPTYDPVTGMALAQSDEDFVGYMGIAHIGPASSAGTIMTGESMTELSSVPVSIPWDALPIPREEDQIIVLDSEDPALVNEILRIIDVTRSGNGVDVRQMSCTFVTANPFNTEA